MKIKTRLAPSPTGHFHIGTARTALFNWLFARRMKGTFLIRIEDTDRARSKKEYETEIMEGLAWLGLSHDEFARQSDRSSRHKELLEKLIGEGKVYLSKEKDERDPENMREVVRLRNPGGLVTFTDEIRGAITTDVSDLGDFVIARSLDEPLFHFAVVVDDADMEITHVIRGEDHIANTPRQILIQEALGVPRPLYAHLPLILAPDRSKLSKRHGATALIDYRTLGFLPEAIVNYLALLGWNPGNDRENFTLLELVEVFSLEGIHKSGAVFDREKLLSVNQRYLRKVSDENFVRMFAGEQNPEIFTKIIPLLKERARTLGEAKTILEDELVFFFITPNLKKELLEAKEGEGREGRTKAHLEALEGLLEGLEDGDMTLESVREALMPYAEREGRGEVLWPLRYALSGKERSPDPFMIMSILGREESIRRVKAAVAILAE